MTYKQCYYQLKETLQDCHNRMINFDNENEDVGDERITALQLAHAKYRQANLKLWWFLRNGRNGARWDDEMTISV